MSDTHPRHRESALLTDLYQLTMLEAYLERDMTEAATFEFFVRRLPERRNFLLAAGLEQALSYVADLRFSEQDLAYLDRTGLFSDRLLDYLRRFEFTGDIDAMPEGTVFFADEPILRVMAPLPEAQLLESRLINILHYQTLIASKAARCVLAAPDKRLVDFGMRRAHGAEAAIFAARASYLAGFAGTATVIAELLFDIPTFGTMAHSFIQAHDSEIEAFEHFSRVHRGTVVLLIDTYDTEEGARRAVEVADRLRSEGKGIDAVRLDSGDLLALSFRVRAILDEGGHPQVRIFASSSLDEYELERLVRAGAPIDGYGIGTRLDVSADAPSLDCAYKIQEYAGRPRRKRSKGKATLPGRKQVFRRLDSDGRLREDVLTLWCDEQPGRPLLEAVMRHGTVNGKLLGLEEARERAAAELASLTDALRGLRSRAEYPVRVSPALDALAREVDEAFR